MKVVKIDKQDFTIGVEKLADSYRLFGPVKEKESHAFQKLEKGQLPDFDFKNTRLSIKSVINPQSEVMLEYSLDDKQEDHHVMKEAKKDYSPRVVFGVRPCDGKAMLLVKPNFDTAEYKDNYWLDSYKCTTLVGLACNDPCSTCFCTSAGSGPFDEAGLDVLMIDMDDHYIAKAVTSKGEDLLSAACWDTAIEADLASVEDKKTLAEKKIKTSVSIDNIKDRSINEIHQASFWEDIAFSCINCGTCTFVCPTCWCFDIQDENNGKSGVRMRNWDSCMFPLFTLHGTGHNPRGEKKQRVRQRFMHKLKYYLDKYDHGIQCVGCGRCIRSCPVNIDIRRVCNIMNDYNYE